MIVHLPNTHWPRLQLTGSKILCDLSTVLDQQQLTESWTISHQNKALTLCQALKQDWNTRIIRFQVMDTLEDLCPYLDNLAATVIRANLETLRNITLHAIEDTTHHVRQYHIANHIK